MSVEEIERQAKLYREQAEAVVLAGRWAAFADDEIETMSMGLSNLLGEWRVNRLTPMIEELEAELERRRA